ncbi:MAG: ABC transporter permease [Pseudomonadales bacterium]|nr:ABC transporter permease [Pseudomonadales bacterium]
MTALLATIKKELLLLTRDIHGLLLLFAMPVIFILIMSLALQNQFTDSNRKKIHILFDDQARSDASTRIVELLHAHQNFDWITADSATAPELIRQDQAAFLLTLKNHNDNIQADLLVAPGTAAQTEAILHAVVSEAIMRERIETLLRKIKMKNAMQTTFSQENTENNGTISNSIDDSALRESTVQVRYSYRAQDNHLQPSSVQQNVPAWLVFAMFFSVVPLANTLIGERQQGTLRRLRTLPIPAALPIIGKWIPYFAINQIQVVLMLLVGVFLMPVFGAESLTLGHSPAGLLLMSCTLSSAALGYGMLIAVLARTTEQASILGGIGNILLGAIGGIMVPRFVMPETMQQLANLSPMCWGLEGFLDIFLRNGTLKDVLPEAGSLLLFGCVTMMLAMHLHKAKLHD